MIRLSLLALCLLLFVGCDISGDSDGALLSVVVETPSGTPVEGLDLSMEYALVSANDDDDGGDRVARSTALRYFDVYTSGNGRFDVEWETEDEEGITRFVVEAGTAEEDLGDVVEVEPLGAFELYEVAVEGAFALFRLRIEFADGSVEHSETIESIVVAEEDPPAYPGRVTLHTGYPNPFFSTTTLGFELPRATDVTLEVVDLEGLPVGVLMQGEQSAGAYGRVWEAGPDLVGGFYRVRLTAGEDTASVLAVYTGPGVGPQDERLRVRTALGETDAAGRFATEDRALFPQLYDGIETEFRDENNVHLGDAQPSREITLVLRDGTGREQRYERVLTGSSSAFELTWDPE